MSRPLRPQYSGAVYHLTSRGNARQKIFLDDTDRELFLSPLSQVVSRYGWLCHSYCLVEREAHLLELCRYVGLNPVRVKFRKTEAQWRWSRSRATAGLAAVAGCLAVDWVLGQLGRGGVRLRDGRGDL